MKYNYKLLKMYQYFIKKMRKIQSCYQQNYNIISKYLVLSFGIEMPV